MPKMMVEKKSKARSRQKMVAAAFEAWLKQNPKATMEEKLKQLDFLSDTAVLNEQTQR